MKVNDFNKVAKTPLEEWIYYLNTGEIPEDAQAPGLDKVRERLKLDKMTKDELNAYYRHLDNIVILRDNIFMARAEGRAEDLAEVRAEGRAEGERMAQKKMLLQMIKNGCTKEQVAQLTAMTVEEISSILDD